MKAFTYEDGKRRLSLALKFALSYGVFLLVCLALGLGIYLSSSNNARENFWRQHQEWLQGSITYMDNCLTSLDSYTRQLTNDSTFIRFTNMKSLQEYGYITAANDVMKMLSTRAPLLSNLPIRESHIYLQNTGYVISASQFTEVRQFYMDYRILEKDQYGLWFSILTAATGQLQNYDTSLIYSTANQMTLFRNIDDIFSRSVPATIWFDWDIPALTKQYLAYLPTDNAVLVVTDTAGNVQFRLCGSGVSSLQQTEATRYALAGETATRLGEYHMISAASGANGWRYTLALPESLCAQALGNYDLLFYAVMLAALLGGIAVITVLVRHHMRPIVQLGNRLVAAEDNRAQLKQELDARRPVLCASYLRRILSGHVSSEEELSYMMDFMGIGGEGLRYLVLYCVAYNQDGSEADSDDFHQMLSDHLLHDLQTAYPVYLYTTLDQAYVVLVTFDEQTVDPLMELQHRILALHNELLAHHAVWFFAGVGTLRTQALSLWESYEQARTAARYTAKQYIFLPYEAIQKVTDSAYYPIEISAKLLHFITLGNKPQVSEMFALIYRENVEERSLPVNMLNFLLSDLRNTLMKARFSVTDTDEEARKKLARLDDWLAQQATFPLCETIALCLCDFFNQSNVPSDPIPEIRDYLHQHYDDPSLCLSKLSDRFHISESYLSHLFKVKTGENFSVHLENLRLSEAAKRLQSMAADSHGKEQKMVSLYLDVGYNNAMSFRRAFKKRFGITPSEMRNRSYPQ